jgi:predicted lipoprotein
MLRTLAIALLAATPAAAAEIPFAPAVRQTIETVIVPGYARLAAAAEAGKDAVATLCETPGEASLGVARAAFGDLVTAFSAVELYRFGPAREDNRIERLFFWPDPRGRGLAQVEAVLRSEDPGATEVAALRGKSVAVQGLPALEFVLFGSGSEALGSGADFRCRYALAIAGGVAETAAALAAAWSGPYARFVEDAGEGNPVYRSHGEAMQDILEAAAAELALVAGMKLAAVIGEAPPAAKPKLAPFWRSGLTVAAMRANLDGVTAVLGEPLKAILGEDAHLADSAAFQLGEASKALGAADGPFAAAVADPDTHRRLRFAVVEIEGAERVLRDGIEAELGLARGFNESDGD